MLSARQVRVYDGSSNAGPLLGEFSGDSLADQPHVVMGLWRLWISDDYHHLLIGLYTWGMPGTIGMPHTGMQAQRMGHGLLRQCTTDSHGLLRQ